MRKLTLWYINRSRRFKIAMISMGVVLAVVAVAVAGYILLVPNKVQVTYGTIVRDPVDGRVWEDDTKTIWVDPSDTDKYSVKYVDKLSPEHEAQKAQEEAQAEAERAALAQSQGLEQVTFLVTDEQVQDMQILSRNVDTMGQNVVKGIDLLHDISEIQAKLVSYRNQVAGTSVAPELEPMKQQIIRIFDLYIEATDLYIQAISTANSAYAQQANAKIEEANAIIDSIMPTTEQLDQLVDEFNRLIGGL